MMDGAGRVVCGRIVRGTRGASAGGAADAAGAAGVSAAGAGASAGFSTGGFGATADLGITTLALSGPPMAGFAGTAGSAFFGSGSESFLIALRTSPGFEIFDRSIFGFGSSRDGADEFLRAPSPPGALPSARRTLSASSYSSELEWVFFSVMPSPGSRSSTCLLFTSSSRAKSLIRTFDIRPRLFPLRC